MDVKAKKWIFLNNTIEHKPKKSLSLIVYDGVFNDGSVCVSNGDFTSGIWHSSLFKSSPYFL